MYSRTAKNTIGGPPRVETSGLRTKTTIEGDLKESNFVLMCGCVTSFKILQTIGCSNKRLHKAQILYFKVLSPVRQWFSTGGPRGLANLFYSFYIFFTHLAIYGSKNCVLFCFVGRQLLAVENHCCKRPVLNIQWQVG